MYNANENLRVGVHFKRPFIAIYYKFNLFGGVMFKDTLEKLRLTRDELQLIQQSFSDEIALGLKGQSSCLGCFNTHVYLPIVHDASHFLAIDLGGTNLRVAFCND